MKSFIRLKRITILILVCIGFFNPITSKGQYWMSKYGYLDNYYLIRDSTDAFFNSDTSKINNKNLGFKGYQRWKTFMEPRVDQNGSLNTYHLNMAQEYENILLTDGDRIAGQWNSLGPVTGTTGPKAELGIVTSLLVEDDQNIYAGTGASGLFLTHDGGANWTSLTDKYLITGIESIIKVNPSTIYIATGFDTWGKVYSKGVLKSLDNGITWNNTGLSSNYLNGKAFSVKGMVKDPDNNQGFLAIVQEEFRHSVHIAKTVDGGITWNNKFDEYAPVGEMGRDLRKIEYDPFNSDRIMASGRFLLVSDNNGDTWTEITNKINYNATEYTIERITTSFHPTIPGTILVMLKKFRGVYTDSYVEIYISTNGGQDFKLCAYTENPLNNTNLSEDKFELEWSLSNADHFYVGGVAMAKCGINNMGQAIPEIYFLDLPDHCIHDDVRFLKLFTVNGNDLLYIGNDGGVTKGIENTLTGMDWIDISGTGLNITQYYGVAINEDEPDFYLGGTQDGNLFLHTSTGWYNRGNVGDGAEAVIDYDNPENIYMVRFCGDSYLYESNDHGETWHYFYTGMPGEGLDRRNDAPLEISYSDPTKLFIGSKNIYRSTLVNGELVFSPISNFTTNNLAPFKAIRVHPTDNNIIVAGRGNTTWNAPLEKLYYVTNGGGGGGWPVIETPTGFTFDDVGIFDIAFDLNYTEAGFQFFIALDGFKAQKKVFKVKVIGGTVNWTNVSAGLPNLPINCIKVYKGSEYEEMFAGTDCGVYYYNNIIGHWTKYGNGMPVCAVSDLEINYKTNQLIASTFGRGMYIAEICEIGPSETTMYITDTQVWEGSKRIPGDISIQSGGNLTIKGDVFMKYNKHITVQPHAILNVDGGRITSHCSFEPWGGIIISGNSTEGQNPLYQGVVFIRNGATIENAKVGVHCENPKNPRDIYPLTGGGILLAFNSTFKNNGIAAKFEPYSYSGGSISYFRNCTFISDNPPLFENHESFVSINNVDGIRFETCTFENIIYPAGNTSKTEIGISSSNSSFFVDQYCPDGTCPNLDEIKNKFNDLVYGIYSVTAGIDMMRVKNSIFNNNDCGIFALNHENPDIRYNKFFINTKGTRATGLYLDHCNGYLVEENEFDIANANGSTPSRGIYVNESGPYDNELYLNRFFNLSYGIVAEGCNRSYGGIYGLEFKCNEFTSTRYDISVMPEVVNNAIGVARDQGFQFPKLCEHTAGNLFTHSPVNVKNFYNGPYNFEEINYTYLGSNYMMRPDNVTRVNVNAIDLPNGGECCLPHEYGGGGGGTTKLDEETMENKIAYLKELATLDSLIDQGETQNKLFFISTAIPDEGLELTQDLLQTSPYVSDTVIKKSIEKENVITNGMLRDIMVANPNTAKSHELIDYLDSRIDPMPEYMKDEILAGQSIQSEREIKEVSLNIKRRAYTYGFNRHLAQLLLDTLKTNKDSLFLFLEQDASFNSLLKKAWIQFETDTIEAISYLSTLATVIDIDEKQQNELTSQIEIMQWMANNPVFDSTQIDPLLNFTLSPSVKVSASALSILISNNSIIYNEPYSVIQNLQHSEPIIEKGKSSFDTYVLVVPNPAKEFISIKYASGTETSSLCIYNEAGKLLKEKNLHKHKDEITVDIHDFKPGIYLVVLNTNHDKLASTKFIISK